MKKYKGDKIWENENFIVAKTQIKGEDVLALFSKERKEWWYPYLKIEFCVISDETYMHNIIPGTNGFISNEEIPDALIRLLEKNNIDPNNREYMINQLSDDKMGK